MQDRLQKIPFKKVKIDSFTLLIPYLEETKHQLIVSQTFTESYAKVYGTGELEDDPTFYTNYVKTENKDSKTFLKYKNIERLFNGERKKFIQIMITSKLLKGEYFEGLNSVNIDQIYNYIIADQVIRISKEDFLNSYVTDIDLCRDFKTDLEGFKKLKQFMLELVIPGKESLLNSKRIDSKDVFGIQYNERHKATPSKPFAKLYFKSKELLEKSTSFYEANLLDFEKEIIEGISRLEVTIKAYKHKERLGIGNIKSLNDLLSIPNSDLENIFNSIIKEYYESTRKLKEENSDKMKTSDLILLNGIDYILSVKPQITKAELIRIFCKDAYDKKQKYDIKNKVEEVILLSENRKKISSNDEAYKVPIEVLKTVGIFED